MSRTGLKILSLSGLMLEFLFLAISISGAVTTSIYTDYSAHRGYQLNTSFRIF